MKSIIFLSITLFFSSFGYAQKSTDLNTDTGFSRKAHSIGLNAGGTSGLLFSYRYMPKKLGIQFAVLPTGNKQDFFGDLGITLLYKFHTSANNKVSFFNYIGNSFFYKYEELPGYKYEHLSWNIGLGYGIDIRAHERISFGFTVGWAGYDVRDDYAFYPDGSTYLFYRF